MIPIVYVKISKQDCLPVLLRDYNQLEYIQTSYTRQEDSAWEVIYGTSDPTKLDDRLNQSFKTDDYGFLPEYRIRLVDPISEKSNQEWVKVGNYKKVKKPENEYKPIFKNSIMIVTSDIFEERMIQRYCEHNLRELSIYHNEWIGRLY